MMLQQPKATSFRALYVADVPPYFSDIPSQCDRSPERKVTSYLLLLDIEQQAEYWCRIIQATEK